MYAHKTRQNSAVTVNDYGARLVIKFKKGDRFHRITAEFYNDNPGYGNVWHESYLRACEDHKCHGKIMEFATKAEIIAKANELARQ